ncbi:hypothetical protein CesoFtcFv8_001715 [Champsocephalus esox]|uniref:Alpha-carbonic anhydrase domain-containing protein n=1 Tax=Champsocephalus esox TaxID=159716 RepID=A0AAN8D1D7_9TELE|nr:hypothetical protein CesoFtcFv8_001715 [Champsocephalus esox]
MPSQCTLSAAFRGHEIVLKCHPKFYITACPSSDETLLYFLSSSGIYGPNEGWSSAYPECRERNQSPINIVDQDTIISTEYQELTLEGFDAESSNKTSMKNTGKTGTAKTARLLVRSGS